MKVSAILTQVPGMWVAQCEEVDRTGEGRTPDEALACLRQALEEYFEVEAVAPPSETASAPIEIIVLSPLASASPVTR